MNETWKRWPDDVPAVGAPVHTSNTLDMDVSPEDVWTHLIRAEAWPELYANAKDVRVPGSAELALGTVFTWRTFGVAVETEVLVFEPAQALAWRGDSWYGHAVHTWRLTKTERGCRVVTEEVQRGVLPWFARWYLRAGLLRWHQRWLEGLHERALRERT